MSAKGRLCQAIAKKSRSFLPERTFAARRTLGADVRLTAAGCSSIHLRLVAGCDKSQSPARQAGPTVGPFCRKGLSPQGEPLGRTSAQRRRVVLQSTCIWSLVATSRKVQPGRLDLLYVLLPEKNSRSTGSIGQATFAKIILCHRLFPRRQDYDSSGSPRACRTMRRSGWMSSTSSDSLPLIR